MRPLELLSMARVVIDKNGSVGIYLGPRAFDALKADIQASMLYDGVPCPTVGMGLTPENYMRYNGQLYFRAIPH